MALKHTHNNSLGGERNFTIKPKAKIRIFVSATSFVSTRRSLPRLLPWVQDIHSETRDQRAQSGKLLFMRSRGEIGRKRQRHAVASAGGLRSILLVSLARFSPGVLSFVLPSHPVVVRWVRWTARRICIKGRKSSASMSQCGLLHAPR